MKKQYQEYIETAKMLAKLSNIKNPKIMSYEEWHKYEYENKVETYLIQEYGLGLLCQEVFNDNRSEEEGDLMWHMVKDYLDDCYEKNLPITHPAKWLADYFKLKNQTEKQK